MSLRVKEAKQQSDVGRSVVRLDTEALKTLSLKTGDIVEVTGTKPAAAKAWPAYPEDEGLGIIRMDGFLRNNCAVKLDEYVQVGKATFQDAGFIQLAPVDLRIPVDEDFVRFVKDRLIDRPLIKGNTILVMMLGHSVPFRVVTTEPSGIVLPTFSTKVEILSIPASEYQDKKLLRFRCLKWMEGLVAADETWFFIPDTQERHKDEPPILEAAKKRAATEQKDIEIRVEFLEKRGSIEPIGFPWASVNPQGEVEYTYPEQWVRRATSSARSA